MDRIEYVHAGPACWASLSVDHQRVETPSTSCLNHSPNYQKYSFLGFVELAPLSALSGIMNEKSLSGCRWFQVVSMNWSEPKNRSARPSIQQAPEAENREAENREAENRETKNREMRNRRFAFRASGTVNCSGSWAEMENCCDGQPFQMRTTEDCWSCRRFRVRWTKSSYRWWPSRSWSYRRSQIQSPESRWFGRL